MAADEDAATTKFGSAGMSQSIMDGVLALGVIHLKGMDKPLDTGDTGALAAYDFRTPAF
jgi:hypothetical protein